MVIEKEATTLERTQNDGRNLERQVVFWSALGPLFFLISTMAAMINFSPARDPLVFVSLMAIPLCWKMKIKGVAVAAAAAGAVILYYFGSSTFEQNLWNSGVASAMLLSGVVTALSFDEAAALVSSLQVESKSRLETLWSLDEQLKDLLSEKALIEKQQTGQLAIYQEELEEAKERIDASTKQNRILHQELAALHHNLFEANAALAKLNRKSEYEDGEQLLNQLSYAEEQRQSAEAAFAALTVENGVMNQEIELLRGLIEEFEEKELRQKDNSSGGEDRIASLTGTIEEKEKALLVAHHQIEEISRDSEERLLVLQKMLEEARSSQTQSQPRSAKKKGDSAEITKLKNNCKVLKEELKLKNDELEESRRSLFRMQEKLLSRPGSSPPPPTF